MVGPAHFFPACVHYVPPCTSLVLAWKRHPLFSIECTVTSITVHVQAHANRIKCAQSHRTISILMHNVKL